MSPALPQLLCLAACAVAAVTDLRRREIPDWITVPGVLGGLLLSAAIPLLAGGGAHQALVALAWSAATGIALFAISGFLGWRGLIGMGDVKLYAAVGTLLGWPLGLEAALYSVLAGGVLSIVWALKGRVLGRALANLANLARTRTLPRVVDEDDDRPPTASDLPYGVAILAGVAWAVAARLV